MVRWLWRGENTRYHSELGRENPQRRWYFVLRHGRVGRCRALKSQCFDAGWSSLVARQAHNLKVAGSNPAPATNFSALYLLGNKMKKAIIYIGGSYPQIDGVKAIKKAGLSVILIDVNKNAPCAKYSDIHIKINATNYKKIIHYLKPNLKYFNVVGIYGISDFANETMQNLNEFLKIKENFKFETFSNKLNIHSLLKNKKFAKPELLWFGNSQPETDVIKEKISKFEKIIIKPASSFSSKGIKIISSKEIYEVEKYIKKAFKYSQTVLIEEYVEGSLVNIDGLFLNKNLFFNSLIYRKDYVIDNKTSYISGYSFSKSASKIKKKIYLFAKSLLELMNYDSGSFTIDTIINNNKIYPLEVSSHLHSVSFYKNSKHHPLYAWGLSLNGNNVKDLKIYKKNIGYCAILTKNFHNIVNNKKLKKFLNNELITDIHNYYDDKESNNYSEKKVCMIFWYKVRSKNSIDNLFKKLNNCFL